MKRLSIQRFIWRALLTAAILWIALSMHANAAPNVHVVDGDTLDVDGVRYRLHGIDTPEPAQTCIKKNGGKWPCGKEATRALEALVQTGSVTCDNRGLDDYNRIIGVCAVAGVNINVDLVSRGLAWSFKKYSHDYDVVEEVARRRAVGIWQARTEAPWDYRSHRWDDALPEAPRGCPIKGNISRNGELIYHVPWSRDYKKTRINEKKGERWFCNEGEALAAGWRAPYWGK